MIEVRDDIRGLSNDGRVTLCASILGSTSFRDRNLAIDWEWVKSSVESEITNHLPIRIWNENYEGHDLSTDNIILCRRAFDTVVKDRTDLYYTRSYNNRHSVFLLEKQYSNSDVDANLNFESYFEDIPVLMNARKK